MVVSRLFVPVREALNVVCVVDCAGEGAGLDELSPSGRRSVPTSEAAPGSQGRAERSEPRSGVLDGQEQRSYQGDHARARLRDACKNRWTERRAPDQQTTVGRVGCAPATSRESPAGWATGPGFSPTIMPGESKKLASSARTRPRRLPADIFCRSFTKRCSDRGSVPLGDAVAVQPAFSGCPACRVQA